MDLILPSTIVVFVWTSSLQSYSKECRWDQVCGLLADDSGHECGVKFLKKFNTSQQDWKNLQSQIVMDISMTLFNHSKAMGDMQACVKEWRDWLVAVSGSAERLALADESLVEQLRKVQVVTFAHDTTAEE